MNTIYSKMINIGGLDVRYYTGGHGEPLIIIHGGSIGARAWLDNMSELAMNYTVFVPDLPGFGSSQELTGDYFIPEYTEFVDKFSQGLELEHFHLMGHSLGGGIVLNYALKFPKKIKKLVLVSSLCLGKEIAFWVRFLSTRILCRALGRTALAILRMAKWFFKFFYSPDEFVEPFCQASIKIGSSITSLKEQSTVFLNRLSEITVPTLVVWGAKDPILPVRQAYAAVGLIPDCRVKVYEQSGHSVYQEKINEFSRLLREFLG